ETCIGCQSCVEACPYQAVGAGVRTYLEAEPEFLVGFPVGNSEAPTHVKNTVEKCNLCYQRISEGDLPACVEGCPTLAMTFGDLNDPESDISKLIAERECEQLLVDAGTGPCMYYLK
ncbi:4Fe-4S dicluster domain-containing protein, partial [Adlercreutzia sp.]